MEAKFHARGIEVNLNQSYVVAHVHMYYDSVVRASYLAEFDVGPFVAVTIETPAYSDDAQPTEVHLYLESADARRLAEAILAALPPAKEEAA